jgi:hypothetical protein
LAQPGTEHILLARSSAAPPVPTGRSRDDSLLVPDDADRSDVPAELRREARRFLRAS